MEAALMLHSDRLVQVIKHTTTVTLMQEDMIIPVHPEKSLQRDPTDHLIRGSTSSGGQLSAGDGRRSLGANQLTFDHCSSSHANHSVKRFLAA